MPLEADVHTAGMELTPDRKVPAFTGTLPVKGTAKKKTKGPDSQLYPGTPAESYSFLLEEKRNGNARGLPQTQLMSRLQTGYGNQYTERVITGVRDRNTETAGKESPKEAIAEEKENLEKKTSPGIKPANEATSVKKDAPKENKTTKKEKETTPSKEKPAGEGTTAGEGRKEPTGENISTSAQSGKSGGTSAVGPEPAAKEKTPPPEKTGKSPVAEEKKEEKLPDGKVAKKGPVAGSTGGGVGEPGGAAAFLKAAGEKAFKKAVQKIKTLGKHEKTHKTAQEKGEEAKQAVVPPGQEAQSRADANQVNTVSERTEPQTNEPAAKQTLEIAVKQATPSTIEDVDDFKDDGKALEIRTSVLSNIKNQTGAIQQTYQDIGDAPKAEPVPTDSPPIPNPEAAPPTGALQMGEKLLPKLPAEQTDLSNYENEVEDQITKEEIDPNDLEKVDSGPLAEANMLRKQVKDDVKTGPEEIKKKEQDEHSVMDQELSADEKSNRIKMSNQRKGKLGNVKGTQDTTKKKEEAKRKKVTEDIQNIYKKAKKSVETKLNNLETDSLNQFDKGQEKAAAKFENTVNEDMKAYKKERYGSYFGWTKKVKDWALGMDKLPRVKEIFTNAKKAFVNEIDTLIKTIIAGSKKVISQCKTEIQQAKTKIAGFVKTLDPELKKFAAQAQKEMIAKLDALDQQVNQKEKELREKLAERREKAIKAIDEKIAKMKKKLKGAVHKLGKLLLNAALKLFKWALGKVGAPAGKIINFLKKAASAFMNIIKSPGKFLGNLIDALTGGFNKFSNNIVSHLKKGLMQWLFGTMSQAGITIPSEFSLKAIFGLVLQVLDLTPAAIKMKVTRYIGEKNMERIEKVWELISILISSGLGGLWEKIKEYFTNLKEMVIDGIREWVISTIIKEAVQWILGLFNPAGAIIKIAMTIYKIVMFIIQRIRQIMAVGEAVIGSLSEIASGAIGKAIDWVEKALASIIPVVIGFLASLLGLSGISTTIRGIIDKARKPVHNALDKVIAKIAAKTGALLGKGKKKENGKAVEKMPPDMKKLWTQGQAAIDMLKKEAKTTPFDEKTISQRLKTIKQKYKFKKLTHRQEGNKWIIKSKINPEGTDEVEAKGNLFKVGRHVVTKPSEAKERGESHHVPVKVLKQWIGEMYVLLGEGIGGVEGHKFQTRGKKYEADKVGNKLSAIWLTYKDHKKVHESAEGKPTQIPGVLMFLTKAGSESTRPQKVTVARGVHKGLGIEKTGDKQVKKSREQINREIYKKTNTLEGLHKTFKGAFSSLLSKGIALVARAIKGEKWKDDLEKEAEGSSWKKIINPSEPDE